MGVPRECADNSMNPETASAVLPGASGEPLPGLLSWWFSIGDTLSSLTRSAPFECRLIDIEHQPCISITHFQCGFRDMPEFSFKEIQTRRV